jgi:shikimate kinase
VIWLSGKFDTLYARARGAGERPMLTGRTDEEVAALYRARAPYYSQAHLTVDTTNIGPDQVAGRVLAALRGAPAPSAGA